jgi:hypothetical protein
MQLADFLYSCKHTNVVREILVVREKHTNVVREVRKIFHKTYRSCFW